MTEKLGSEIACDAAAAYVLVENAGTNSEVRRIEPGKPPVAIATGQRFARSIAVDDARVYWFAGSAGAHSYVATTTKEAGGLVDLYYDDGYGSTSFSALAIRGAVLAFAVANGRESRIVRGATNGFGEAIVARDQGAVPSLAIDGPRVYWVTAAKDQILRSGTGPGAPPEPFASGSGLDAIALSGGELFWTTADGVLHARAEGATPRVVASELRLPRGLTVDARSAFWVETGDPSTVATAPSAGGPVAYLGEALPSSSIAVCPNAIWLTKPERREVLRLAR